MAFPGQVRQVADQPQARDEGRPTLYLVRQVRDRLAISGSNIREDLQASQPYLMLVKSRVDRLLYRILDRVTETWHQLLGSTASSTRLSSNIYYWESPPGSSALKSGIDSWDLLLGSTSVKRTPQLIVDTKGPLSNRLSLLNT